MRERLDKGVLYIISGDKHANVLVASVYSLRKSGFTGPVHFAAGDDRAREIVRSIMADSRLGEMSTERWFPPTGSRGDGYRQKTFMRRLTPFYRTVFLDADTIVRGSIDPLFEFNDKYGVTLTQFSTWMSNGRKITGRIKGWTDVAADDVETMSTQPFPAINTGVIAFDWGPLSDAFFNEWATLTARKPVFINDELAAQLIFHRHGVRVVDSRWNYSAIHDTRQDWVILHMHGKKHVRRDSVRKLWMPWYDECVRENIADIAHWTPAGDRHLRAYLEGLDDAPPDPDDAEES